MRIGRRSSVTQDSLTTRPIGSAASAEPTTGDELPRTRRRLGGWQIATGDLTGDELAPSLTGDLSSAAIDTESLLSTDLSTTSVVSQTTPFLASLAARLAPHGGHPMPVVDDPVSPDATVPLSPALESTRPAAASASDNKREVDQAEVEEGAKAVRKRGVVQFDSAAQTALIDESCHRGNLPPADTVPLTVDTRPISQETRPIAQETTPTATETRQIGTETSPLASATTQIAQVTTPISAMTHRMSPAGSEVTAETRAIAPATTNFADV